MSRILRTFAVVAGFMVLASGAFAFQGEDAYERGLDLYRKRSFRAAIVEFDKILEVEPNRAEVQYLKGYCQYMLKDFTEAVETFGRAFQADPTLDPRTIYKRAAASSRT